jgi:hypothetical protein
VVRWGYNTAAQIHAFTEKESKDPRISIHETQARVNAMQMQMREGGWSEVEWIIGRASGLLGD